MDDNKQDGQRQVAGQMFSSPATAEQHVGSSENSVFGFGAANMNSNNNFMGSSPDFSTNAASASYDNNDNSKIISANGNGNSNGDGNSNNRKRRSDSMSGGDLEDILSQITNKMDALNTNGDTHEDMLTAFVTVLDVDRSMAEFFCESADWNLETAVAIYLENTDRTDIMREYALQTEALQQQRTKRTKSDVAKYRNRNVNIEGLPADWQAMVSRREGTIYFRHIPTNHTQFAVPDGFADALPIEDGDGIGMDAMESTTTSTSTTSISDPAIMR
jgi:hypothetical protein